MAIESASAILVVSGHGKPTEREHYMRGRTIDTQRVSERAHESRVWNQTSRVHLPQEAPKLPRHMLASAALSLAQEHHASVSTLISSHQYASAAALLRPLLEATIVAGWSIYCAKPDHVVEILFGRKPLPEIRSMMVRLDRTPELRGLLELHKIEKVISVLHDLTHGGMQQLGRRFTQNMHEATFDTAEVAIFLSLSDWIWCFALTFSLIVEPSPVLPERHRNRTADLVLEIALYIPAVAADWPGWQPFPEPEIERGVIPSSLDDRD